MSSSNQNKPRIERPKFLPNPGEVMTYKSYYYLHRKTSKGNAVLKKDFTKGWFGYLVNESELKQTPIESWIIKEFSMPPFSAAELEEFRAMSDEKLLEICNL